MSSGIGGVQLRGNPSMMGQKNATGANNGIGISHSESNPILNAPVINDRVRLDKLNHVPSMKSNLLGSENMSIQGGGANNGVETASRTNLNYLDMPVVKKSVLAPLHNLASSQH